MKKDTKNSSSVILRIGVFVLSVYMIITLCSLYGELSSKQKELNSLKALKQQKSDQIETLVELLGGSEQEIIAKAARERLGYVYADEQVYVDNSGN